MASSGSHKISSYPLATGIDLDQVRQSGFYDVDAPTNGPSGETGTLFMIVFEGHTATPNNQKTKQIMFVLETGDQYTRHWDGITWADWEASGSGGGGSGANLTFTRTGTTLTVVSDSGTDAILPAATTSLAGLLTATDKAKLDATVTGFLGVYTDLATLQAAVPTGTTKQYAILTNGDGVDPTWGVWDSDESSPAWVEVAALSAGPTNLTLTRDGTTVTILSDTGTDAIIPAASTSNAGAMSAADKTKLDGIASGAQVNPSAAAIVSSINSQLGNAYRWQGSPQSFNVLDYGADPSGVDPAANRTAFANAIAALAATGKGGEIYAPGGLYTISAANSPSVGGMILQSNMTLRGDGIGRTIIQCADLVNKDMSGLVRTASGTETYNVMIRDLTLDGNKAAQTGWANTVPFFCGVTPGNRSLMARDIWLVNVEAKNGRNGTTGSGHDGGGGYGFDPHEVSERIVFMNCIAHDNEEDGFVLDGCTNFSVIGCRSWSNGRHGFNFVTESHTGIVADCASYSNASNNFMIQTDSHHIQLDNCYSGSAGEQGIRIRAGGTIQNTHCKITNCLVKLSGRNGISVTGASYNVVSNNKIIDSSQTTNNTYMDISLDQDDGDTGSTYYSARYNIISNNEAFASAANKSKYGFRENYQAANEVPKYNTFLWNTARGQVNTKYSTIDSTSKIYDAGFGAFYAAEAFGVSAASADNGAALRTLVDLVETNGGGTILLPAGILLASGTGTASQGVMTLPDNVQIKGQGIDVTVLAAIDAVNTSINGIIRTKSGGTNVGNVVSDLTITAQTWTGTGDVYGLYTGATTDDTFIAMNVKVTNMQSGSGNAGYGVRTGSGSKNAKFINVESSSNERDGFYIDASNGDSLVNCKANSNSRYGFNIHNAFDVSLVAPFAKSNTSYGIIVDGSLHTKVAGGTLDGTSGGSISTMRITGPGTQTAMYTIVNGMTFKNSQKAGLEIVGSDYNTVSACMFVDNGQATNNTYSDVLLDKDASSIASQYNTISNCLMRATQTNKTKYGIGEAASSGCDNNFFLNNRFNGQVTASTLIQGASTRRYDFTLQDWADDLFAIVGSSDRTKRARFEVDGLTTATTRVVTVPDKDGTMAMLSDIAAATTDYADGVFRISDNSDATKKIAFEASGITTGTVRTITMPDKNGTLAMLSDIGAATPAGSDTQVQYNNAGASAGAAGLTYDLANVRPGAPNGLQLADVAPSSVGSGKIILHAIARSSDIVRPAYIGATGIARRLQSNLGGRSWGCVMAGNSSAATTTQLGITVTSTGTGTAATLSSSNKATSMKRMGLTSAATTNAAAGWQCNSSNHFTRGSAAGCGGFYVNLTFGIAAFNATGLLFAGVGSNNGSTILTATALTSAADIFGVGMEASDTNLQWITNDNSGNITKTDLGSNFVIATAMLIEVEIYCAPNSSDMYYTVKNLGTGNIASGTLSSNLPRNTIFLCPSILIGTGASSSTAATIEVGTMYYEADI